MCAETIPLAELRAAHENPEFGRWNATSVAALYRTLYYAREGEERDLALSILDAYVAWRKTMPEVYLPPGGTDPMPLAQEAWDMLIFFRMSVRAAIFDEEYDAAFAKHIADVRQRYEQSEAFLEGSVRPVPETKKEDATFAYSFAALCYGLGFGFAIGRFVACFP